MVAGSASCGTTIAVTKPESGTAARPGGNHGGTMAADSAPDPANDMTRRRFLGRAGVAAGGTASLAMMASHPANERC
jgi:hypothetical protein